ncbi:hypothetical protein B0181_06050 [Moraxella caviae]|uniref:SH3 domain-containing protein n=1 Tax=Moraxella caviae TaxID=34060 RepID=A0A1T0A2A1_9GAMM|nr:hypothetical protein [Moraxella caviae]OOR89768.1 hypothetical protein B0181_06050 [Moraxella caviae]STZ10709.1 Uncharacterised protein [Moraxella caviae]
MRCTVLKKHQNIGIFKTIAAGTRLTNIKPCPSYEHWYSADVGGLQMFVYGGFLANDVLTVDYNPTELDVDCGDVVELLGIYGAWAWVRMSAPMHKDSVQAGEMGWLPCAILHSAV